MISYHSELKRIFGDKFGGYKQVGDELVEWRLKPGAVATEAELKQVGLLTMPRSSHISVLEAVDTTKARPARVRRVWGGINYFYDCFATQTVVDEYKAGKISIGDYVIVHFDDTGEQIVTAKVFKSW